MRILNVLLENTCQTPRLEFDLSPGLNAFIGPNGSGKSNALKMVYGSLTNDFSRNPGTKEDNVRQLAGPKEVSQIRLRFEHQGATYQLTRQLRPLKQELLVPGEKAITRDALVNQRVLQVLGVTPEMLDKYIFVDQWEMFGFLMATETDRAKAFQRLFGTLDAERAWDAVGEVLGRTEVPQLQTDLDGQRHGLAHHARRIEELRATLAEYAHLPERLDPNSPDQRALQSARRRTQLEADIQGMERRLREWSHDLTDARQEQVAFAADRAALQQTLDGGAEAVNDARAALKNWQTLKQVQQARSRTEAQLERARQEATIHSRPNKNGLYVSDLDDAVHKRHEFLAGEISRAERFLQSFDAAKGHAECPTCFTPVANLADTLQAARDALPGMRTEMAELDRRLKYSRDFDRQEREYQTWHAGWAPRVTALEAQLADLKTVPRPDHDEAVLSGIVAEAAEVAAALRDVAAELAKVNAEVATLEGKIQGEEARLRAARAEHTALGLIDPGELADIEARIAQQTVAIQQRAALRGELAADERYHQAFADSIALLESQAAEADRVTRWVRHLGDVRAVLHRNNLPRVVAEHYLRALQVETNQFLEVFDAPFRVEADDKLSFRALFNDGREQPAGRLSGGEKVVLALAFRLSVNSMFAAEVGLLCLDEPTVGLDEHNLGCLQTALLRLKELSRERGLQVIMVTHERSLGHLFDRVIDPSGVA